MLGAHKIKEQEPTQLRMTSKNFTIHEGWNPRQLKNDIALIKLPESVKPNGKFSSWSKIIRIL